MKIPNAEDTSIEGGSPEVEFRLRTTLGANQNGLNSFTARDESCPLAIKRSSKEVQH